MLVYYVTTTLLIRTRIRLLWAIADTHMNMEHFGEAITPYHLALSQSEDLQRQGVVAQPLVKQVVM